MYSQEINIIKTPPINTENRHTIDGIKIYQSIPQAINILEEMLYQQALGNGHVWKYEIGGRKIHSIQVLIPSLGAVWLIVPSMTREDIQDVINAVGEEGGGNLYFVEGEYLLEDPLLIRHSNIHLYGQNLNTVIKCNADWRYAISKTDGSLLPMEDRISANGEYAGIIDIRGAEEAVLENIKISGIRLDGNRATAYSYGIYSKYVGLAQTTGLTEGVGRYDSTTVGNTMVNKTGVKIENCIIEDCYSYGIYLNSAANNTVTGNTVQNNNNNRGIYLTNSSNNNSITGNTVQNNGGYGIYLTSSNNNTITGNTIQNNSSRGIFLHESSNNNTITGNTVQNNGNLGIYLTSSSNNNTITGNTVQNNGSSGISLGSSSNNNTITGNTVQNNSSHGINLQASNNTITGNTVQSNGGRGIDMGGTHSTVTGNIFVNNSNVNLYLSASSSYNIVCSNQHGNNISNSGTGNKIYNNK